MYGSGLAQFYDFFEPFNAQLEKDLARLQSLIAQPSHVLDVGAGTASLSIRLAESGYTVVALEPSDAMRAVALTKCFQRLSSFSSLTLAKDWGVIQDVNGRFDLVMANAVLHLVTDDLQRQTLVGNMAAAMKPGSLALFDFAAPYNRVSAPKTLLRERDMGELTYRHFSEVLLVDVDAVHSRWIFEIWSKDKCIDAANEDFYFRTDVPEHACRIIQNAGLVVEQVLDKTSWTAFNPTVHRSFTLLARRP